MTPPSMTRDHVTFYLAARRARAAGLQAAFARAAGALLRAIRPAAQGAARGARAAVPKLG